MKRAWAEMWQNEKEKSRHLKVCTPKFLFPFTAVLKVSLKTRFFFFFFTRANPMFRKNKPNLVSPDSVLSSPCISFILENNIQNKRSSGRRDIMCETYQYLTRHREKFNLGRKYDHSEHRIDPERGRNEIKQNRNIHWRVIFVTNRRQLPSVLFSSQILIFTFKITVSKFTAGNESSACENPALQAIALISGDSLYILSVPCGEARSEHVLHILHFYIENVAATLLFWLLFSWRMAQVWTEWTRTSQHRT